MLALRSYRKILFVILCATMLVIGGFALWSLQNNSSGSSTPSQDSANQLGAPPANSGNEWENRGDEPNQMGSAQRILEHLNSLTLWEAVKMASSIKLDSCFFELLKKLRHDCLFLFYKIIRFSFRKLTISLCIASSRPTRRWPPDSKGTNFAPGIC